MDAETFIPTRRGRLFAKIWTPDTASHFVPVILLHDSLGSVTLWRDFPERLALETGRKVIAYDRLGFGRSDPHPARLAPPEFITDEAHGDFRAVLGHFEIKDFAVLGYSVGGGMGIGIAAHYGARCEALVTMSAQTFAEPQTLAGVRAAKSAFAAEDQRARLAKYHGDKVDWVLDAWIESWLSPQFDSWSLDTRIAAITCPVLAIHGGNDEFGSTAHAKRIKDGATCPVTVSVIGHEGHTPHRGSAGRVLAEVRTFLDSNKRARL